MVIWIDPPRWPGHGLLWSHLISDRSEAELHAFAARLAVPGRGFDADHYDLPEHRYAEAIAAGARATTGPDLLRRLQDSGLRVPKGKSERLVWLASGVSDGVLGRFEVMASPRRMVGVRHWAVAADGASTAVSHPCQTGEPLGYRRFRSPRGPAVILDDVRLARAQVRGTPTIPDWLAALVEFARR